MLYGYLDLQINVWVYNVCTIYGKLEKQANLGIYKYMVYCVYASKKL